MNLRQTFDLDDLIFAGVLMEQEGPRWHIWKELISSSAHSGTVSHFMHFWHGS